MKRFWLVLLSLGLVMAFSVSAFAVDVKVSGEYYAAGMYLNRTNVNDDTIHAIHASDPGVLPIVIGRPAAPADVSTAFFFQRLRIGTDFVVSPCLKLVTRFDAMERIWGGARDAVVAGDAQSAGTRSENENIAFDLAYIEYISPVGLFRVGYQPDYEWGTVFGNRTSGPTAGIITYAVPIGPVTLIGQYAKETDNSASAVTTGGPTGVTKTDRDDDSYRLGAIYKFGTDKAKGEVGGLFLFNRSAGDKADTWGDTTPQLLPPSTDIGYLTNVYKVIPYFKTQIGPVAFQGEFEYTFGNALKAETSTLAAIGHPNSDISAWSAFLDATATFGPVYFGGSFVYLSGDDPGTHDKLEGSNAAAAVNTVGLDWNPCLIMFNTIDTQYWAGSIAGYSNSAVDNEMSNAYFFQGRVGVKPIPQLDFMMSVSYATADKKPVDPDSGRTFANGSYGWEIDATGTYKITNNLSYMLGVGYLFTGDYYKGIDNTKKVNDDYMLINKLTLSF